MILIMLVSVPWEAVSVNRLRDSGQWPDDTRCSLLSHLAYLQVRSARAIPTRHLQAKLRFTPERL